MGLFTYFSYSKTDNIVIMPPESPSSSIDSSDSTPSGHAIASQAEPNAGPPHILASQSSPNLTRASSDSAERPRQTRRLSFRPFSLSAHDSHKPALSAIQEERKKVQIATSLSERLARSINSDKRAKKSAYAVRALIVGPSRPAGTKLSDVVARPRMTSDVKSQLAKPKSANKIIAHLRCLSQENINEDDPSHTPSSHPKGPIHAVCLSHTEAEEETLHFQQIHDFSFEHTFGFDKVAGILNDMSIVDLILAPDLGLGQPGDGPGLLAGAVPTAETVIKGIEQVTPELFALAFTTGKAIIPDHAGIHPPTDRMSVMTYWWGFEVVLPPPSLVYLDKNAHSVSNAVMNFLTALSMVNNGVREILPFVRYISQFVDFEFNAIKAQDKGKGVVLAATWLMPAALVPRPWDFVPGSALKKPESQPVSENTPTSPSSVQPTIAGSPSPASIPSIPTATPTMTSKSPYPSSVLPPQVVITAAA